MASQLHSVTDTRGRVCRDRTIFGSHIGARRERRHGRWAAGKDEAARLSTQRRASAGKSCRTIWQKTFCSRTRRAMSWPYCEAKSNKDTFTFGQCCHRRLPFLDLSHQNADYSASWHAPRCSEERARTSQGVIFQPCRRNASNACRIGPLLSFSQLRRPPRRHLYRVHDRPAHAAAAPACNPAMVVPPGLATMIFQYAPDAIPRLQYHFGRAGDRLGR